MNILNKTAKILKLKYLIIFTAIFFCCVNIFGQGITWQRTYNSIYSHTDIGEDICDAGNSNFFIIGTAQRLNSYSSIFALKINKFGDTLWTRYIDTAYGKTVVPSGDGGCVITGIRDAAFTTKIDSSGNIVWFKKYSGNIVFTGHDIIKSNDGGYLVCGTAFYNIGYIFKIDSQGEIEWEKFYPAGYVKYFNKILSLQSNGYLLAGTVSNAQNDTTRGLLCKIDISGNIIWEKDYIVNVNTSFYGLNINNNGYLLSGEYFDGEDFRIFFKRVDINGIEIFTKIFISNSDEFTINLIQVNTNKYVISAERFTNSFPFVRYPRIFITDSLGNIMTEKYYNALGDLVIKSILPVNNNDVLFTGYAEYLFSQRDDIYALRTDSLLNAPPPIAIINQSI
ncbi:MAG: hypothetical protein IT280_13470, partial [Ignavibacteria bacterium]|nr:hypothetical protein [Ignavibacteria bacterium]